MNSYENKNEYEYEILDASQNNSNMSNRYQRYPLAHNPQTSIQTTNYKDWLRMCQNPLDMEGYDSNSVVVVSTGLIVVGTLISILSAGLGSIPIIYGTLLPVLWNDPNNPQKTWHEFMSHGETLLNQTISTVERNRAAAYLEGYTTAVKKCEEALNVWLKTPNQANARTVADLYKDTDFLFFTTLPHLKLRGYETLLLSSYTQAANMHLILLKQASKYADQWNAQLSVSVQKTANDYYTDLVKLIGEYTDYCIATYRLGLTTIKSRATSWNIYNMYRREMTILVLDLVALFPAHDIKKYPSGTKVELTREIYTDALGAVALPQNIDATEQLATRAPNLFSWLKGFKFITTQSTNRYYLSGIANQYSFTNSNGEIWGPISGNPTGVSSDLTIDNNFSIYKLSILRGYQLSPDFSFHNPVHQIDFSTTNNQQGRVQSYKSGGPTPVNPETTAIHLPIDSKCTQNCNPTFNNYSHILSYAKTFTSNLSIGTTSNITSFGWTHNSVDRENTIDLNNITQIPAVKASQVYPGNSVIKGPGHTGGNLVRIDSSGYMSIVCKFPLQVKGYRVRIRYAANNRAELYISSAGNSPSKNVDLDPTFSGTNYESLNYTNFKDKETEFIITEGQLVKQSIIFSTNGNVLLDKIEFIPLGTTTYEYEEKQNLEKAQKALNALFTDGTNGYLQMDTTDYDINQTANLIECVSDELYAKEKIVLLDEVKYAKRLSISRNLLLNDDLEFSDGFGENGWTTSDNISIQADNPIFKGNYLKMFGARDIDGTLFPTYLYQKIEESKLKPYTRYRVRGFVGSSKDLKLVVTRYEKEIDAIMNVPNDLAHMQLNPSCGDYRCESSSQFLVNQVHPTTTAGYALDMYARPSSSDKKHIMCHDRHPFDFHIDTGELNPNTNLGIDVLFKISNPNGYATLGNLEVIEEGPLTDEALVHVKQKEKKWRQHMEKKRMETQQAYDPVKQAVDALFTNEQELDYHTTLDYIKNADQLVQAIPYVHHAWLPDAPGMNYDVYQGLNARIMQAYNLYDARNIIINGDFTQGLQGWHATGKAAVQQIDGASVLVLSNWSAEVSQNLHAQDHHGYMLRVIAKKEGPGKGYVTMMDCNGKQETLTFTSCEEGYITKTIEVFPESNRIRIEMGETEGTFYVDSIELLCMQGYASNNNPHTGNMYEQSYNGNYNQNTSDVYHQGYINNYNQNSSSMYNQNYINNDDLHSGCTCNQGHNSGCTCNQGYNR
uniref:Crystaline entomocidal protoxin n=1 Tax=Bacillus thuringiensis TaxID=1428 RepID=A0A1C6ZWC9_BACTU|nr:insecticidal crystal protein 1 [Bacillus thuringiensis]